MRGGVAIGQRMGRCTIFTDFRGKIISITGTCTLLLEN